MAYVSKAELEKYLLIEIDSSFDAQIAAWAESVKVWIDRYTGRTFESGVASTKYYDGSTDGMIFTHAFTGTPTVELLDSDGNTVETVTDDVLAYPLNTTEKTYIVIPGRSFGSGYKRVKVTANFWSSDSVPADIKLAATKLLASIIEDQVPTTGAKQSESLGDYSVTYAKDPVSDEAAEKMGITSILDQYRDITI